MNEKIILIGSRPAISFIKDKLGQNLIGAEIGTNKGYNASYICNTINPKILYLVDPWNNFFDPDSGEIIGEAQFQMAKETLKPFSGCIFIREPSLVAVKKFKDEDLDFVYIDGEHSYEGVTRDVFAWYPKVKKGGIISGHDFTTPNVQKAVINFCKSNQIKNIFGQDQDFWFYREDICQKYC